MSASGRVTLEQLPGDDARQRYAAVLSTEQEHRSEVTIELADGAITFGPWEPCEPPAWLLEYARQFLRSAWRSKTWPPRINRWREAR